MVTVKKAVILIYIMFSTTAFAAESDISTFEIGEQGKEFIFTDNPLQTPEQRRQVRQSLGFASQRAPSQVVVDVAGLPEVGNTNLQALQAADQQRTWEQTEADQKYNMSQSPKEKRHSSKPNARTISSGSVKAQVHGRSRGESGFEDYTGRTSVVEKDNAGDIELGEIGKKGKEDFYGVGPSFAQRCEEAFLEGTGEAILWGSAALSQASAGGFISEALGAKGLPDVFYYLDSGLYTGINGVALAQKGYQYYKKKTTPILPNPAATLQLTRTEKLIGTCKDLAISAKENPGTAALVIATGVSQLSAGFLLAEALGSTYEPMKLYVGDSLACTALNIGAAGKLIKDKCIKS